VLLAGLFASLAQAAVGPQNLDCGGSTIVFDWNQVPAETLHRYGVLDEQGMHVVKSMPLGNGVSEFVIIGPVFSGPDKTESVSVKCQDDGVNIITNLVRPSGFHGDILANVLWRPKFSIGFSGPASLHVTAYWNLRSEDQRAIPSRETAPLSFPIILSKDLRAEDVDSK
jgi:hypothetical protein